MQEDKKLLTVEELARFLNCSQGLIHKLKDNRGLPFLKIGASVRFDKEEVLNYLRRETDNIFF